MDEQEFKFDPEAVIRKIPMFDERRVMQDRRQYWRDKASAERRQPE